MLLLNHAYEVYTKLKNAQAFPFRNMWASTLTKEPCKEFWMVWVEMSEMPDY